MVAQLQDGVLLLELPPSPPPSPAVPVAHLLVVAVVAVEHVGRWGPARGRLVVALARTRSLPTQHVKST